MHLYRNKFTFFHKFPSVLLSKFLLRYIMFTYSQISALLSEQAKRYLSQPDNYELAAAQAEGIIRTNCPVPVTTPAQSSLIQPFVWVIEFITANTFQGLSQDRYDALRNNYQLALDALSAAGNAVDAQFPGKVGAMDVDYTNNY